MHDHPPHDDVQNIKTAFFLNLAFTIIEFIGGYYVNSVAIISDAIHDLGDSISLLSSWYFQKLSHKGRTKRYSYGYKRFSVLSAIINSTVLLIGSVFILSKTIPRLLHPEQPDTTGMIWLAVLGVLVNGAAVVKTRKGKSMNERVVSLHLMEDVLGWIAVLIGSLVMTFFDVPILDPILSILITAYILINVFKNLNASFKIILQGTPSNVNVDELKTKLLDIPEVTDIHDLHTWSMDGEYHIVTLHLVLAEEDSFVRRKEIKQHARQILEEQTIHHATIELELANECYTTIDPHR
ncbi:cobalt transporter [Reichenbachiella sp. 5M10]|uniref:cation diffusion facilitator family transporter n=1 Tax=Reichenbachiella sp. 5M10 TaxID=1889772 RepID=UPI000C14DE20|nr:cation diffusion facilitator family transporter [Reichenbachiella sp. 5M10]PIB34543.1 cobalt transporter [Reichenbachiella sp. 5M10]